MPDQHDIDERIQMIAERTSPPRPRRGRPPAGEVGRVTERILDAATALFLENGFGRTTLDQVAVRAKTGKSSVYGYFTDKETLFAAVVHHSIAVMFADLPDVPSALTTEDKLRVVGRNLAESLLVPRCAALMRMTAAEALSLPNLAQSAYQTSFDECVSRIKSILNADPVASGGNTTAFARRFIELALQPLSFQATFGGDLDMLRERVRDDIEDVIFYFKATGALG